jgi:dihydropteroate synthase
MGILNCTPDSFYAGSRQEDVAAARKAALEMIRAGADILDIGGESTRPNSVAVDDEEQLRRVIPVIQEIRYVTDIPMSIDTRSARVAEAALNAGASIINDISAFTADPDMVKLAAERGVRVVLMHMKGTPADMQKNPTYRDAPAEIRRQILGIAESAIESGVRKENIILDPGIGFGKRPEDNAGILGRLDEWRNSGYSLMIGLSRKSFLGLIMDDEDRRSAEHFRCHILHSDDTTEDLGRAGMSSLPQDRLAATIAAHAWCLARNVDFLRVHDVREARILIAVWEALSWAS